MSPVPFSYWALVLLSGLLTAVGLTFLLLLNGQVYTNSVICAALLSLSGVLWLVAIVRAVGRRRAVAKLMLVLHCAGALLLVSNLPRAQAAQKAFNAKRAEISRKAHQD